MKNSKLRKGFTLVELIVVVAVLALLAVGAVFAIRGIQRNARMSANRAAAVTMAQAFNGYLSNGGATAIPGTSHGAAFWTGTIDSPLPGGDATSYTIALSTPARFNQVRGWLNAEGDGASLRFVVNPDANFDVLAS